MKKNYYSQYKPSEFDLELICNLIYNPNSQLEYSELPWGDKETFMLPSDSSQEQFYMRKEAFENLSSEAKEVVNTVLNSPDEILQLFCNKFGNISRRMLEQYFHKNKGWNNKKVIKTFREISGYVKEIL